MKNLFNPILIHDFLTFSAGNYPSKTALICNDESVNYKDFDSITDNLAFALIQNGLKKHDRVIIYLDNCIELALSVFAVLKAGGVFVCLSAGVKSERLAYTIKDSGAKYVIADGASFDTIEKASAFLISIPRFIWIGGAGEFNGDTTGNSFLKVNSLNWSDLIKENSSHASELKRRKAEVTDYDLAALVYTSGSTGEPKGVMCSHFNMLSVSRSVIQYLENSDRDIILNVLPLSFVYGLYQLVTSVIVGGTLIIEPSFLFPSRIIQIIQQKNVTGLPIIPTIAALLLKLHGLGKYELSSLRYITNAGAALPAEHILKLRSLLPHVRIFSMYGCAECLRAAYLPPDEIDTRPDSVGKAIPNSEVFVLNENGCQVGTGEIGELVVRGSHVMRGYWNAPELTAKVFRTGIRPGEVLLHTGDYFRQDEDGYLYFVCRKDDMIKTAGKKVSPKEVENLLYRMKGIAEASVIGVPDAILGQAVKAFVVLAENNSIKPKDIINFCDKHLEKHMIPKIVEIIDQLPRTVNGKIDKLMLKQL